MRSSVLMRTYDYQRDGNEQTRLFMRAVPAVDEMVRAFEQVWDGWPTC